MQSTQKLLLITAPFTQLNTPYPATVYLKGYLNTLNIPSHQCDLGIEVILSVFSRKGLEQVFEKVDELDVEVSPNIFRIHQLKEDYLATIDAVIHFLQNKNPTLAHLICDRTFLPEASRFQSLEDLEWAFGTMGIQDKARHLATLYLEDLGDFIKETVDPHFGFSRYAERLGRTASHFKFLEDELHTEPSIISQFLIEKLEEKMQLSNPSLVCLSVPFPGNLFASLLCGKHIKTHYPKVKVVLGGGYANTELRQISDPNLFNYIDFVALDDGEKPLYTLIDYLDGNRTKENLKRIFLKENKQVVFYNANHELDIPQKDTGTPDYADLMLNNYLSVIELANPMHRMWSDGRWNKLTLAHGCYWAKCSFCDISLDYIKRYEPLTASLICDRMETLIQQTGENGFHFVDEAAPPNLLKALALEILKRGLVVSWWTNIRFEKHFTDDLAYLLKASGCIAVAGGLEVASDRLLHLMKKGVTVEQVARVANGFTKNGILVHAYLMYGFPTQTAQETIDSLEMVRQLFANEVLQSGFWHQFAMTAHSPVGLQPQAYQVEKIGPHFEGFAENDYYHSDPTGANHQKFSEGLRISLFNYMHGLGLDYDLKKWFSFPTPKTSIPPKFIEQSIRTKEEKYKHLQSIVWLGNLPQLDWEMQGKKKVGLLEFYNKRTEFSLVFSEKVSNFLFEHLALAHWKNEKSFLFDEFQKDFEKQTQEDFSVFWKSKQIQTLRENGLLLL